MRTQWGHYVPPAEVCVEWLESHPRRMLLTRSIQYVGPDGLTWGAIAGDVINGASVPWFFRRVFPAYIGRYRRATVIHDSECVAKRRPSWQVHRMFYAAMRCDSVGPLQAWIMWAAVRTFGPRF